MRLFRGVLTNLRTPHVKTDKFRPFSTKPATYQGIKLSYVAYGDDHDEQAPPLIIMHGLFGSHTNWKSLSRAFNQKMAPRRRVIAVDARNHGDSPHMDDHNYHLLAADVKTLLETLGVKRGAMLGHSMGGRAMMCLALSYPELVEKLVVVDMSPLTTSPTMYAMLEYFELLRSVKFPSNVPLPTARKEVDRELSRSVSDPGLRAFFLTNLKQEADGSYGWRMNLAALEKHFKQDIARFPEMSGQFSGPTLFIAGGKSDFLRNSDFGEISKLFPRAEYKEIPGAGHWVHSEKPNEFLAVCLEFLNRKQAKASTTTGNG